METLYSNRCDAKQVAYDLKMQHQYNNALYKILKNLFYFYSNRRDAKQVAHDIKMQHACNYTVLYPVTSFT